MAPRLVRRGGPATITGVLYQTILALARCTTLHSLNFERDEGTGAVTTATLILEPGTGGDQEVRAGERIVEQIKHRSTGRWSLRELIVEVLPDLYRAVDLDRPLATYRFVTNAQIGEWQSAYRFFRSLKAREPVDIPASLDDTRDIDFARRPQGECGFWGPGPYTERRLFERIVAHVRSQTSTTSESVDAMRRKTWELLSKLEVEPGKDFAVCEHAINRWLEEKVDVIEQLPEKREALLADLLHRASEGDAEIHPAQFLEAHGLTSTSLAKWDFHARKSRALVARAMKYWDYSTSQDVRPELAASVAAQWRVGQPFLAIAGESGKGKTCLAFSMLCQIAAQGEIVLFVEATGDGLRDMDTLAGAFWQDVIGHDNTVLFNRIRERVARVDRSLAARPLFLLIDGVSSVEEGFRLARLPIEELSLRLAITCPTEIAKELEETINQKRFGRFDVPDFSSEELARYLASNVGGEWAEIPEDVRATLRRPLLAKLYCAIASDGSWRPTREYELYERFWNRLYEGEQREHPMDASRLAKAAFRLLRGAAYPWTADVLCGNSADDSLIPRLSRAGWLRSPKPGAFEVWHDRLLNWAVAQGSVAELDNERLEGAELVNLIRGLSSAEHPHRSLLRYVPMDVLWLVSGSSRNWVDVSASILEALEDT